MDLGNVTGNTAERLYINKFPFHLGQKNHIKNIGRKIR